jgi:hypothetical protein
MELCLVIPKNVGSMHGIVPSWRHTPLPLTHKKLFSIYLKRG